MVGYDHQQNVQHKDTDSDVISESVSSPLAVPRTPLAREHSSQQRRYLSANNDNDDSKPISIDNKDTSLAVEAAVAIVINGIHYAVLMASPSQLEYLAIGFLFSEGLIEHSYELLDWEVTQLTDIASLQAFARDDVDKLDQPTWLNDNLEHLLDYDTYVVELVLNQRCHQRIQAKRKNVSWQGELAVVCAV